MQCQNKTCGWVLSGRHAGAGANEYNIIMVYMTMPKLMNNVVLCQYDCIG